MAAGTAMVTVHDVRFKGREHHGIRVFCTCGWHIDAASGQTLTGLAALIRRHGVTGYGDDSSRLWHDHYPEAEAG